MSDGSDLYVLSEVRPETKDLGELSPGDYLRTTVGDDRETALLACPGCGEVASLADHEIRPDGTVTPSVVCPVDDCDFHRHVRLDGWPRDGR